MNLAVRAVPGTTKRLTRAAFFTFATTLGAFGVLAGCNGDDSGSPDAYAAGDSGYGAPNTYAGSDAAYGVPSTFDANEGDSNFGLGDAGFDADDANDGGDD